MSHVARKSDRPESADSPNSNVSASTRVDAPHIGGDAGPPQGGERPPLLTESVALPGEHGNLAATGNDFAAGLDSAAETSGAVQIVQQVRAQAGQLANHLRRQQAAIDHREAELNARAGVMEAQFRGARLWLGERQQEFTELRAELDARERALEARAAEIAGADAACQTLRASTEQELRQREAALETREAVLATRVSEMTENQVTAKATWGETQEHFRKQELALAEREMELNSIQARCVEREQELARRPAGPDSERSGDTVQPLAEALQNRLRQLDAAELLLAEEQGDLQRAREAFYAEQTRWQQEFASARHKLHEDRQQFARDVEKKKQLLRRRRDDLDARLASIKQLRAEVSRTQRETLELRLATEELWARLCGTMAPAALTQSLGQLRLKLADQNRLAQADVAEQRMELQRLSGRLAEQHEKLLAHRKELQSWATRRTAEVEQQAALLVAREQELDRQENEMRQAGRRHHDERRSYQQEIRKLMRKIREADSAAATA